MDPVVSEIANKVAVHPGRPARHLRKGHCHLSSLAARAPQSFLPRGNPLPLRPLAMLSASSARHRPPAVIGGSVRKSCLLERVTEAGEEPSVTAQSSLVPIRLSHGTACLQSSLASELRGGVPQSPGHGGRWRLAGEC